MAWNAFYLPDGPKNLAPLFGGVDFTRITEYFVQLLGGDGVLLTTPTYSLEKCIDNLRIHFISFCGPVDSICACKQGDVHESKSDSLETPLRTRLSSVTFRPDHTGTRFNIKANSTVTAVTTFYGEDDMDWIQELIDSPAAWLQSDGSKQGQPDGYVPITILDQKIDKFKQDDRFVYEVAIQFIFSASKRIVRSNVSQDNYFTFNDINPST